MNNQLPYCTFLEILSTFCLLSGYVSEPTHLFVGLSDIDFFNVMLKNTNYNHALNQRMDYLVYQCDSLPY